MEEIKFRGKNETGWHYGLLTFMFRSYAISHVENENVVDLVDRETVSQYTGIKGINDVEIYGNDITKLVLPDGEVRYFVVKSGAIERWVHLQEGFRSGFYRIHTIGIYFEWIDSEGEIHKLLACVDENGVSDASKMEVVGNIHDNPELLEVNK
ncbi:hypothetical protein CKN99_06005 [Carnobacterium maltaromaticum]|uniref:YopX family protein n=1 Tax=Carnobacterium maltaromaticum TaxID=2751 RepID=UPI001072D00C|nr:YopX family protein [Carnobacterium maltaromaticum]MDT1946062.1 YopX family protein [Carnobacterium maltaromaticum]MDT2000566.1 YopX family protein [Carnobacterium maltaromaticum]TFJ28864.1 hypothetical protein CKN90_05960 [Carnobacterium maltaromaticum]TFJ32562.1 hypothetical protein CKN98_05970 [Carnobacterium maltaromaticum]TFJ36590.1 hypothetical protein CKN88_06030 [Carnobacterium maltaromaticum]